MLAYDNNTNVKKINKLFFFFTNVELDLFQSFHGMNQDNNTKKLSLETSKRFLPSISNRHKQHKKIKLRNW